MGWLSDTWKKTKNSTKKLMGYDSMNEGLFDLATMGGYSTVKGAAKYGSELLGGDLFGKGNSADQTVTTLPWNDKALTDLQKKAHTLYGKGGPDYYNKDTVADMPPELQASLEKMMGFSDQGNVQAGNKALTDALSGFQQQRQQVGQEQVQGVGDYASFLMNQAQQGGPQGQAGQIAAGADPTAALAEMMQGGQNPYVDQLVAQTQQDLSRNLNENIMPRIDQGSMGNNAYGGSRQGLAQAKAIEGTQRQAADASARIRGTAYESDQNRRLGATGQAGQLASQGDQYSQYLQQLGLQGGQLGRGLSQDLSGITGQMAGMGPLLQGYEGKNLATEAQGGNAIQQYQQQLINADKAKWDFNQNKGQNNLNNYANLLMGVGGLGSSTTTPTPQASGIEKLLGGVSSGLGAYGGMASAGIPGAGWLAGGLGLLSALG